MRVARVFSPVVDPGSRIGRPAPRRTFAGMVHFGEAGSVLGRRTLAVAVEFLCARADFGLLPLRTVLEREGLEAAGSLNGCIMADSHAPTHRTREAVVDTKADRYGYATHTMRRPLGVMPWPNDHGNLSELFGQQYAGQHRAGPDRAPRPFPQASSELGWPLRGGRLGRCGMIGSATRGGTAHPRALKSARNGELPSRIACVSGRRPAFQSPASPSAPPRPATGKAFTAVLNSEAKPPHTGVACRAGTCHVPRPP